MKKLSVLLAVLLVLSLLLAACGQTAEPEVATSAPAEAPTEAVVEQPTETEGPAPAAEGKWCSGTKIVFFPGGSPGGPFATVVYNGAVAAADLGADVEYVWSDRNPEKIVTQFAEAAATKPDGIAIMGHHGDDAVSAVVADAEAQGIIVTGQNTTLPTLEAQYKTSGFGYVGAERYSAGYALGPRQSVALGLGLAIRPWSGVSWHRLAVASGPRA